jgi:hypothetical protein
MASKQTWRVKPNPLRKYAKLRDILAEMHGLLAKHDAGQQEEAARAIDAIDSRDADTLAKSLNSLEFWGGAGSILDLTLFGIPWSSEYKVDTVDDKQSKEVASRPIARDGEVEDCRAFGRSARLRVAKMMRRIAAANRRARRDAAELEMKRLLIRSGLVIFIFPIAIMFSNGGVKVAASPMVPTAETLAGLRLGDTPAMVIAAHPNAKQARTPQGATLTWNTAEGAVTVLMGATGRVAQIDFKADENKDYSIDLPCVGQFPIHDSHVNLGFALEQSKCGSIDDAGTYKLIDGSVVTATFEDSGDGPLREAVWYWPENEQGSKP